MPQYTIYYMGGGCKSVIAPDPFQAIEKAKEGSLDKNKGVKEIRDTSGKKVL